MVAKPLCPLYKNIIKPLDRARYPELRYIWSVKLFLYEFRSTYFPILKSKELPSLFRDGSSCLKGILGGNHQFARAKMIAVGQCTDAAIDSFHIILLIE